MSTGQQFLELARSDLAGLTLGRSVGFSESCTYKSSSLSWLAAKKALPSGTTVSRAGPTEHGRPPSLCALFSPWVVHLSLRLRAPYSREDAADGRVV